MGVISIQLRPCLSQSVRLCVQIGVKNGVSGVNLERKSFLFVSKSPTLVSLFQRKNQYIFAPAGM